ncbi:hypothetical protein OXX80_008548 [Metschnikowia pulcherrima]
MILNISCPLALCLAVTVANAMNGCEIGNGCINTELNLEPVGDVTFNKIYQAQKHKVHRGHESTHLRTEKVTSKGSLKSAIENLKSYLNETEFNRFEFEDGNKNLLDELAVLIKSIETDIIQ